MPKQVGNQNRKRLLRYASFGTFIKLFVSHKTFQWGCFAPLACCARRQVSPLPPTPLQAAQLPLAIVTVNMLHWMEERLRTDLFLPTHTNTHTHPFNGPFSRTTQVGRYQKGRTNLDFTEARDSEWQWHQLGICKSAPRSRQITMPTPHHSVFYRPDALPATQPTVSKHWRHNNTNTNYTSTTIMCMLIPFLLVSFQPQIRTTFATWIYKHGTRHSHKITIICSD